MAFVSSTFRQRRRSYGVVMTWLSDPAMKCQGRRDWPISVNT